MLLPSFGSKAVKRLERRKGGGGGGRGGGSGGSGGSGPKGSGSSGSSGSSGGGRAPAPVPVSGLPSGNRGASSYGQGGGKPITIPAGTVFAGRTSGGGTRDQVFGSRTYGSGYPGQGTRSVAGRGFPFGYWPIVWGVGVGAGTVAYLHSDEYGRPDNSSRPGGPLVEAPLMESNDNTTYHLVSDNSTVGAILSALESNCSLSTNSITPRTFNPDNSSEPQPEQAIQYYRSSSVVLTLNGYNNSATDNSDANAADTPLPSGLNMTFLDCLNQTIAASAPLENAAPSLKGTETIPLWGTVWLLFVLVKTLL